MTPCACGATHPHICLVLLQPVKAFYVDPSTSERFDVHAHWVFGEAAAELRATIGVPDKELREL